MQDPITLQANLICDYYKKWPDKITNEEVEDWINKYAEKFREIYIKNKCFWVDVSDFLISAELYKR